MSLELEESAFIAMESTQDLILIMRFSLFVIRECTQRSMFNMLPLERWDCRALYSGTSRQGSENARSSIACVMILIKASRMQGETPLIAVILRSMQSGKNSSSFSVTSSCSSQSPRSSVTLKPTDSDLRSPRKACSCATQWNSPLIKCLMQREKG